MAHSTSHTLTSHTGNTLTIWVTRPPDNARTSTNHFPLMRFLLHWITLTLESRGCATSTVEALWGWAKWWCYADTSSPSEHVRAVTITCRGTLNVTHTHITHGEYFNDLGNSTTWQRTHVNKPLPTDEIPPTLNHTNLRIARMCYEHRWSSLRLSQVVVLCRHLVTLGTCEGCKHLRRTFSQMRSTHSSV